MIIIAWIYIAPFTKLKVAFQKLTEINVNNQEKKNSYQQNKAEKKQSITQYQDNSY